MKKRLLTVLLAVCLVLALGTVSALADDGGMPTASGNFFFANGTPITISATAPDGVEDTQIGLADTAKGNSAFISWVDNGTTKYVGVSQLVRVYGGGNGSTNAVTIANTSITMTGGRIHSIYGGNFGADSKTEDTLSAVTGDVEINLSGSADVSYLLHGGGAYNTCVLGTVYMNFDGVDLSDQEDYLYVNGGVYGNGNEGTRDIENGHMDTFAVANNVVITAANSKFVLLGIGGSGSTKVGTGELNLTNCTVDDLYISGINGELENADVTITGCTINSFSAANRGFIGNANVSIVDSDIETLSTSATSGCFGSDSGTPDGSGVTGSVTYNIDAESSITESLLTPTVVRTGSSTSPEYSTTINNVTINKEGEPLELKVEAFTPVQSTTINEIVVPDNSTLTLNNANVTIEDGQELINTGTISMDDTSSLTISEGGSFGNAGTVEGTVIGDESAITSYIARIGNNPYQTFADALAAAQPSDIIEILGDFTADISATTGTTTAIYTIGSGITINGNGHVITVTGTTSGTAGNVFNIYEADGVVINDLTIEGQSISRNGINVVDSKNVTLNNVTSQNNKGAGVVVNNSSVVADGLYTSGNGWYQGVNIDPKTGESSFTLKDGKLEEAAAIRIEGSSGTSTTTIEGGTVNNIVDSAADNSTINIEGGVFGESIESVADTYPPYQVEHADDTYTYHDTLEDALAEEGNVTYVGEDGEAVSVVLEDNGKDVLSFTMKSGETFTLPTPTRSGYEFRGWRDNSGELHKAGETVTVNGDMTFTAVWSAINIPDTYDIEIADATNGSVDTSLSNASAGSTITITATPDSGYSVASVTVTGPGGRVDVVRVNATTYTFKMPAGDVTVRVTFTDSDALPFTDVSAGQWFYDAVAYVYTNGMMEGDSATTFNPDGTMTRAMFWAVLGRIDGATITGTNWAEQAREWAMAEGVSDGTDPNGLVTREQMVTMLWRYAGEPESTVSLSAYTDADSVSDWAETAMRWAIDEGIITGMTDTTLVPQGTATRAQCAAIFMRFDQM